MKLHFAINKQQLKRTDDEIIASYSKNFIQCVFYCDEKWCHIHKYALFVDVRNNKTVVNLGHGRKVKCTVPENVLQGNYFLVSVFGDERLTTTQETVLIQTSGLSDAVIEEMDSSLSSNDFSNNINISSDEISDDIPHRIRDESPCYIKKSPYSEEHLYY